MIVVTGATGQLGRAVLTRLLSQVPASQVAVSVRDVSRVADLPVRARPGDYTDRASLEHSFEGATTVLLVSAPLIGEAALSAHRTAIDAAMTAGVKRIVYTGHMGARPDSPFPPMRGHFATEKMLAESGVAHTVLRNGYYATAVPMLLRQALETGELRVPSDGPVAWTTHADLAEAATRVLLDQDVDGPTPPLTGPAAVDMAEVADLAAQITGRPIRHVVVPDADYRNGLPEPAATMLAGMFAAARRGDFGPASPALATLIGRPATPLDAFLRTALG